MKNLKKKFGKYALSHKQANVFIGGQDYTFCCYAYTQGSMHGESRCSENYATAMAMCSCPTNEMCTPVEKIYR